MKFKDIAKRAGVTSVSTLAVEWIEIMVVSHSFTHSPVSTLAVEWIEMPKGYRLYTEIAVSTLAVEWIEIISRIRAGDCVRGLHPRGGVD